jgi:hypothetical protein
MHIPCADAKSLLQSPTGFHRSLGARLHGGYISQRAPVRRSSSQRNSPVPHAGQTSAQRTHAAHPDHLPAYPGVVPCVNRSLKYPASAGAHGGPHRSSHDANAPSLLHRDPRKSTGAMVKTVVNSIVATHTITTARMQRWCCQVPPSGCAHLAPSQVRCPLEGCRPVPPTAVFPVTATFFCARIALRLSCPAAQGRPDCSQNCSHSRGRTARSMHPC